MNNIHDKYRFFYDHPLLGEQQIYPSFTDGKLVTKWVKDDDSLFFRKTIDVSLIISGDEFMPLYDLDRSPQRCDVIDFRIEKLCNEEYTIWFEGTLNLVDGDFNRSVCVLTIQPRPLDEYTCILDNWEDEKDFIGTLGSPESVGFSIADVSNVQNAACSVIVEAPTQNDIPPLILFEPQTNCIEDVTTWNWLGNEVALFDNPPSGPRWIVTSNFQRQVSVGDCSGSTPIPPEGDGWILIQDNCPDSSLWARPFVGQTADFPIPNGYKLSEVLEWLIDCIDVSSDFFNINPIGDAPDNAAYALMNTVYSDMRIHTKSDVINPLASQSATRGNISVKDMLLNLQVMFDIQWAIVNGVFRIEHESFFETANLMLDLTQPNLVENIKGKHRYTYVDAEYPQREIWSYMEPAREFAPVNLRYENNCVTIGEETTYVADKFNNNLYQIITFGSEISNQGFVLLATDNGQVISEQVIQGTGAFNQNAPMSFTQLIKRFHTLERPLINAQLGNEALTFDSTRSARQQEPLSISICCDDINTFNPLDRVKTQLGWGKVEEAEYRDPEQVLELTLKFKA